MKKMTDSEVEAELINLPGWSYNNRHIEKKFIFNDHRSAFSFMTIVAFIAEKLDHHPNWSGVNNEVLIRLSTHEVDDVTSNDLLLANEIEKSF